MSKSTEKGESCLIEHFLFEICLASDTMQNSLIYSFICLSLYFCVFQELDDQNIEVEKKIYIYIYICFLFIYMFILLIYIFKTRVLNMKSNLYYGTNKIKLNCYILL